jgi:PAS domain S-box-containing protein
MEENLSISEAKLLDLVKSENKYRKIFECSKSGILILDFDTGYIVDANDFIIDLLGYPKEKLLEKAIWDIGLLSSVVANKEKFAELQKKEYVRYESLPIETSVGKVVEVEFISSVYFSTGKNKVIQCNIRDITFRFLEERKREKERVETELRLQRAQKMEAISHLAGGFAHNLNNLLTVIKGYTSFIMSKSKENREELLEIEKATSKATLLTKQLLAFSRKQVLKPIKINLNDFLQNLDKMLSVLVGETIKISYDLESNLSNTIADQSQLEQVLINLVSNAKHSMGGSGEINIETKNVEIDSFIGDKYPGFIYGKYVMVSVSDKGCGMSKYTMDHLFEPFFTTKEKSMGTGLGLSMAYGIIKQSNGYIVAYSEVDIGSVLKVYLPAINPESNGESGYETSRNSLSGTETVLLVEDEDLIRNFTKKLLEYYGYTVLEADSGEKALEIAFQIKEKIDLLLTDVVLPKTTGKQVSEEIAKLIPDCKVIFCSGYNENTVIHQGILIDGVNFIQKPYSSEDLLIIIRRVLNN